MPKPDPDDIRVLLDALGHDLEPSILIGGWATNIRVGGDISYDIDLIMRDRSVDAKLHQHLEDVSTNEVHQGRKYKAVKDGVPLDIYIPYESQLGMHLRLRVERLIPYSEPFGDTGWYLLVLDAHFVTKLAALLDRSSGEKGEKDARELFRLLEKGIDPDAATRILVEATASDIALVPGFIERGFGLISGLSGANQKQRRALARQRRVWIDAAHQAVRLAKKSAPQRPNLLGS